MNSQKFWNSTKQGPTIAETLGPCLLWNRSIKDDGYGQVWYEGRNWRTHILAWTLTYGPVPKGKEVCHKCDTPACMRLEHLFIGTHKENYADAMSKGRIAKGEDAGPALLTTEQVLWVREKHRGGASQRELAEFVGVSRRAISHIVTKSTWRHI